MEETFEEFEDEEFEEPKKKGVPKFEDEEFEPVEDFEPKKKPAAKPIAKPKPLERSKGGKFLPREVSREEEEEEFEEPEDEFDDKPKPKQQQAQQPKQQQPQPQAQQSEPQYIAVPRVVSVEDMFNEIYNGLQRIEQILMERK